LNIEVEEITTLEVTIVPDRRFKDLAPREVNHIQTLKTFIVPVKVEHIKERTIIHKAIIFDQSDSNQSPKNLDHDIWRMWVMEHENSENIIDDGAASHPFGKKLHMLAEKVKCLRDITRAESKHFDDLWNDGQNKIMGPDGKMKYTRGLGYKLDDASSFEGSFGEHHSYQIRENYCMTAIEALKDRSEEDSFLVFKNALKQLENAPNGNIYFGHQNHKARVR
jgi:hypothetical protein